jgi:pyruvate kinase
VFQKDQNILTKGDVFVLDNLKEIGNNKRVYLSNRKIFKSVKKGHLILIDDGNIHLKITSIKENLIRTKVLQGGILKSNKGLNLPQSDLKTSALSNLDKKFVKIASNLDVDWIALSFVQKPADIKELRKLCNDKISVMAKIEKPSALKYINEICEIADGIMIARGDLGVELPIETVPGWQKKIIRTSRVNGKACGGFNTNARVHDFITNAN